MKKIGIATLYTNSTNYGGCLQSYSLCKKLSFMGYEAKQIRYVSCGEPITSRISTMIKRRLVFDYLKDKITAYALKIIEKANHSDKSIAQFKSSFVNFRESIPHTELIYNDTTLDTCTDFDVYITGSDQVWNIGKKQKFLSFFWLDFVPKGKEKISYAASISTKDISDIACNRMKHLLSTFKSISVREQQDREFINALFKQDVATWVLDPTLLLPHEHWEQLCTLNRFNDSPYIFVYLLGDSMAQRKFIISWAKKFGKKIITIPYLLGRYRKCDKRFGDIKISDVTPNMWLSLIKDADCVFTDSFHAAVFASIFHTPFYVFKRTNDSSKQSMNSRIYSLMNMLNTEDRIIDENCTVDSLPRVDGINFIDVDKRIETAREKSENYLKNAIEG